LGDDPDRMSMEVLKEQKMRSVGVMGGKVERRQVWLGSPTPGGKDPIQHRQDVTKIGNILGNMGRKCCEVVSGGTFLSAHEKAGKRGFWVGTYRPIPQKEWQGESQQSEKKRKKDNSKKRGSSTRTKKRGAEYPLSSHPN